MRKLTVAMLALAAVVSVSATREASAQSVVGIGIGGGVAMPMGDFGDAFKMGFGGGAGLFVYPSGSRIGLRAEVGYLTFDDDLGLDIKAEPLTVMGSILVPLTTGSSATPYLLGGAGILSDDGSALAFQGGLGVSIGTGPTRFFIEGKYLTSSKDDFTTSFIPLMAGVSFRFGQ
jgi:hypothetical protein